MTPESKTKTQRVRSLWNPKLRAHVLLAAGCTVIGQVRSQVRDRPHFQLHLNPFVLRLSPGQQRKQKVHTPSSIRELHLDDSAQTNCTQKNMELIES